MTTITMNLVAGLESRSSWVVRKVSYYSSSVDSSLQHTPQSVIYLLCCGRYVVQAGYSTLLFTLPV